MANLLSQDERYLREMCEDDAAIEDALWDTILEVEADGKITNTEWLRLRAQAYASRELTQAMTRAWCNRAAGRPVTPVEISAEAVLA